MTDKPEEPQIESLVVPIWPGLMALGFRTKVAAHAAVRKGRIPPEALVKIGHVTRISKKWIARVTSGEAA
jgi:hypothetical protein